MEYSKKHNLEQKLNNHIVTALNNKVFSGLSMAVSKLHGKGAERVIINAGKTDFEYPFQDIENNIFFDLASLTKPLVTVLSLYQLVREKRLCLDDKLETIFPKRRLLYHQDVTLGQLLSHCSGMSAHKQFFSRTALQNAKDKKKAVIEAVFNEPPEYIPGTRHLYSDLGYMILGEVIEKIAGTGLNRFWYEKICQPLGLESCFLFPPGEKSIDNFAVTGECPWTHQKLAGKVHDDNCRFMGGIAGHAGLFGTIEGVCRLCEVILESVKGKKTGAIQLEGFGQWLKRREKSNWCYGFDMVSQLGSSSGRHFTDTSVGHLGFTGVSFWIDLERELVIVLLTNRVINPDDNREIKKFRPLMHNTVMEFFLAEQLI